MIRTVALLGLVASASASFGLFKRSRTREGGLNVRFDASPFGVGTTSFIDLPRSVAAAAEKGWKQTTPPDLHAGYAQLSLFCPPVGDCTVGTFYDDTGYIAGVQVALHEDKFSDSIWDWGVQGFTRWTVTKDGRIQNFWTTQQYYITPEFLGIDPAIRVAQRNPNLLLQDNAIVVSGFNREPYRISTDTSKLDGPNSDFTKQACIPWMGQHYYYNTTVDSECKADTLFPYFALVDSGQLIGLGLVTFGKHTVDKGDTDWFEIPPAFAVKAIVPRGPECLYDLANSPGLVTMHSYFINQPHRVLCVL